MAQAGKVECCRPDGPGKDMDWWPRPEKRNAVDRMVPVKKLDLWPRLKEDAVDGMAPGVQLICGPGRHSGML